MREVPDPEFAAVSRLPGPRRYEHFVKRVADWEQVWSLRSPGGWVLTGDPDGRQLVPVWPHARYAEACAEGEWAGARPEPIPLDRWLEAWTPGMARDGHLLAVTRHAVGGGPHRLAGAAAGRPARRVRAV